ncbi:MAG TPA: hypothetical protein VNM45_17845 [Bacillus sp. (in: firmicutes)]|nr:hypothetical protein [Bacillus sp. (in: firmicutes)]
MTAIFAYHGEQFVTMCGDGRVWDLFKNAIVRDSYPKIHLLPLKNLKLSIGTAGHVKVFEPCVQEMMESFDGQNWTLTDVLKRMDEITVKHMKLTIEKTKEKQSISLAILERLFNFPSPSLELNVQYLIGGNLAGQTFLYRFDYRNMKKTIETIPIGTVSYIGTNREAVKPSLISLAHKLQNCQCPDCCEELLAKTIEQMGKAEKMIGGTIQTMTITS